MGVIIDMGGCVHEGVINDTIIVNGSPTFRGAVFSLHTLVIATFQHEQTALVQCRSAAARLVSYLKWGFDWKIQRVEIGAECSSKSPQKRYKLSGA